jgi:hypothetical protein
LVTDDPAIGVIGHYPNAFAGASLMPTRGARCASPENHFDQIESVPETLYFSYLLKSLFHSGFFGEHVFKTHRARHAEMDLQLSTRTTTI